MSKKYQQVKINFYPDQHKILSDLSEANNQTIAQFIREKLDLNIDEKDIRSAYRKHEKISYKKTDPKLIYQLNKIGNNLNQIARIVNTKKEDYNSIDILKSLVKIEKAVKELL